MRSSAKLLARIATGENCFMSKKSSKKRSTADKTQPKADESRLSSPILKNANGDITIKVLAKPGSKLNAVTEISDEGVGIQISSPPVDGEANSTLVRYVATLLGVRKSDVTLDKGSKSRSKVLTVSSSNLSAEDVAAKFQQSIDLNR